MNSIKFLNRILLCNFAVFSLFFSIYGCSNSTNKEELKKKYPIIPTPQEVSYGETELLFKYVSITGAFQSEILKLEDFFNNQGIENSTNGIKINFIQENISDNNDEAYTLSIDKHITISATTEKGAYYAIQTLKQLFRKNGDKGVLPKLKIKDWPAFKIRGFMHDTGRNFQSVSQLKEQIEIMSQYKYNVFHWHLTDNPGWRLESKLYPELQSAAATTRQKGNFYTQDDFKEVLAFCKARNITVIPELDIPGHTEAFRKALNIETMRDHKVKPILLNLFRELIGLADAIEMPYIHIGTDEVKGNIEAVSNDVLLDIMNLIKDNNREVIVWKQGIQVEGDTTSINQLWAQHEGRKGHRYIDSRANYINHLDPFAGMGRLYFQQPCRQPEGDSLALGGILCAWPDNNIGLERDIIKQNPTYPSLVFYADAIWKGREQNMYEFWAKLPKLGTEELEKFKIFEKKVITHRDLFFKGKEFPYIKQTDIIWKVIGPLNHEGNVSKSFPIETSLKENYNINGEIFKWKDSIVGGTVHLKHFFGFPSLTDQQSGTFYAYTNIYSPDARVQDFWIGFQGWSRSGRRGGPTPNIGQWHTTNPKIWVNNIEVSPPIWKQPNLGTHTDEIPYVDEDYFYREPTKIHLKKGWNKVLLKIPQGGVSWKWMFTCIPVSIIDGSVTEVNELKFNTNFDN